MWYSSGSLGSGASSAAVQGLGRSAGLALPVRMRASTTPGVPLYPFALFLFLLHGETSSLLWVCVPRPFHEAS